MGRSVKAVDSNDCLKTRRRSDACSAGASPGASAGPTSVLQLNIRGVTQLSGSGSAHTSRVDRSDK